MRGRRSPLVEGVTGRYFENCSGAGPHRPGVRRGVAARAMGPQRSEATATSHEGACQT
ncbi:MULTISPECIES: hypothetical protein [unclassified Streptomyces]|uniref:hypothetical protein n=1 Tax=unclassified Streptomyces TaxID=2593676 RepID=UPI0035D76A9F